MIFQREIDEEAGRVSAQKVYLGLTTRAAHQALLDAFRALYGESAGPAHTPWRAYPTTTPALH